MAGAGATDLEGDRGGDREDGGVRVNGEQLVDGEPSESAMSASVSVSVSRCHSFAGVRVKFSDQHVSPHIWLRLIQLILLLQDWSPV